MTAFAPQITSVKMIEPGINPVPAFRPTPRAGAPQAPLQLQFCAQEDAGLPHFTNKGRKKHAHLSTHSAHSTQQ